jgi:hypothetical protein
MRKPHRTYSWEAMILCCCMPLLGACNKNGNEIKPPGFSPTRAQVVTDDRIARCNTVHSQTLPQAVRNRYGIEPSDDTAVIACSLQIRQAVPANIAAQVKGTQHALSGLPIEIQFKEILEDGAVSYLSTFDIGAKTEVRFQIVMTDPQTGKTYDIELRQENLPGRV